ncbi:MAG: FAD-binding protein [Candidatus Lokiarchaeota archaeon]|nr:FAD-binding protein [Candidatus Lokiarchaeota archaeon]
MNKDEIYDRLVGICTEEDVSIDDVDLISTGDWIAKGLEALFKNINFKAGFLVTPKNKEEIVEIIKLANQYKIPIIPRAANTSYGGQVLPIYDNTIMMDFGKHINKILEINIEEEYCVVQPGCEFWFLQRELGKKGYFFPAEPGSAFACMIGGMVGNNASGATSFRFGTTRDFTKGLEVVLASGKIIKTGKHRSGTEKSVTGLDLTSLFVGSEGTLGIFTEITLKIQRIPKNEISAIISFGDVDSCFKAIELIRNLDLNLSLLEYADEMTLDGMNKNFKILLKKGLIQSKIKVPKKEGTLLIKIIGTNYIEDLERLKNLLQGEQFAENPPKIEVLETSIDQEILWNARHNAGPGLARSMSPPVGPRMYIPAILDIAVPPSKVPDFLKKAKEMAKSYGFFPVTFGHVLDGNVHLITAQNITEENLEKVKEFQQKILDIVFSLGGTITAEHGVGLWKQQFLEQELGKETIETMKLIKNALDPNNILNPGKMALGQIPDVAKFENLGVKL